MVLSAAAACANNGGSGSKAPVKVGLSTSITGAGAFIGVPAKLALEDYVAELNKNGGLLGHPVELVFADYGGDVAVEAVTTCNRMIEQDKVISILGPHGSAATIPMANLVDAAKIPMITSGSNSKCTIDENGNVHPYVYRVCYIDPYLGDVLANYAYNEMGCREVAILETIGEPYCMGLANNFESSFTALGGKILSRLGHQNTDVDFRAQITEAQSLNVDAIFMPCVTYLIPSLFANQAKEMGADFQYIMGDAVYNEELMTVAGPACEGSVIAVGVCEDDPSYAEFRKTFSEKHPGETANMYTMYTLDAMKLLEWAVNKAQSVEPQKIKEALETAANVELFTDKNFSIDPETHDPLKKTVTIMEITDSKYEILTSFKPE